MIVIERNYPVPTKYLVVEESASYYIVRHAIDGAHCAAMNAPVGLLVLPKDQAEVVSDGL